MPKASRLPLPQAIPFEHVLSHNAPPAPSNSHHPEFSVNRNEVVEYDTEDSTNWWESGAEKSNTGGVQTKGPLISSQSTNNCAKDDLCLCVHHICWASKQG